MRQSLGFELGRNVPTVTFAVHLLVSLVFLTAAVLTLLDGGPLPSVALQTVMAVLLAGLGVSVARLV